MERIAIIGLPLVKRLAEQGLTIVTSSSLLRSERNFSDFSNFLSSVNSVSRGGNDGERANARVSFGEENEWQFKISFWFCWFRRRGVFSFLFFLFLEKFEDILFHRNLDISVFKYILLY